MFMNWLEIAGTSVGVLYLYWEYKASFWLWVASIAMPALYLGVYLHAGLYADFAISVYYIVASLYGLALWMWQRHKVSRRLTESAHADSTPSGIAHTPRSLYIPLCVAVSAITLLLGWLLSRFTDSTVPWADAFTTAMSIVALWMLAKKYLEQWLVWMVVDVAYTLLYLYKELYPTSVLYLAYAVVAVFGYYKWKKLANGYES